MDKNRYELGLYEKAMPNNLSWKEKLELTRESGFDYLEMSVDESDEKLARLDWTQEERDHIKETMIETGVPIRSMCLSGHRKYPLGSSDPAVCARGMEIMEKAIQLADDLGVRIIQLAGYDVYYDESTPETVARFGENLKKAVRMAARAGVLMGFETMETEFMNTCAKSMKYVVWHGCAGGSAHLRGPCGGYASEGNRARKVPGHDVRRRAGRLPGHD